MLLYTGCGRCWYAGGGTSVGLARHRQQVRVHVHSYSTFIGKSKILCQNRFVEEAVSRDFYLT